MNLSMASEWNHGVNIYHSCTAHQLHEEYKYVVLQQRSRIYAEKLQNSRSISIEKAALLRIKYTANEITR